MKLSSGTFRPLLKVTAAVISDGPVHHRVGL